VRLFIAINFPDAMRQRLWSEAAPLRDAGYPVKWVAADNIHMTVKFLGEVEESRAGAIEDGLSHAVGDTKTFSLSVGRFGAFPSAKRPRVIWVGCETEPGLELLADAVEREMSTLAFETEGRAFRPHVTIGRVRRGARPADLNGLEQDLERLEFFDEPQIASLDLMRSHTGSKGPRYELLANVELA
jgi:2'-5' RNA ligase